MDLLKLQSTEADWHTKCLFHISAYIYSNLLDISPSYFIKILSYRERLDVDSQRTKKCTLHLDFRGKRVENKEMWTYETLKNDFIIMPFILIWLKIKTNLIKLILDTFISITIILQDCPILSPSEPDQVIRRIWAPFDLPRFTHWNLTCFKSGVSHFSAFFIYLEIEGGLHHFRTAYVLVWIRI